MVVYPGGGFGGVGGGGDRCGGGCGWFRLLVVFGLLCDCIVCVGLHIMWCLACGWVGCQARGVWGLSWVGVMCFMVVLGGLG